jgi:ABC-type multidrug transport system ATPase subunit
MRAISRLVATSGLLLLGAVAFERLPLDYLPKRSFPELTVGLTLPEAREPAVVARDWVEEIEAAIRSLGRVTGTAGEVRSDGAELRVRFAPGTDPESKAARLGSELTALRRRLPHGAVLSVDPAAQVEGNLLALVWLSGVTSDAAAEAAAEELRGVPGVRSVDALGVRREELRVELAAGALDPAGAAARVRAMLDGALRQSDLGRTVQGDRRLPVIVSAATAEDLGRLPVRLPAEGGEPGMNEDAVPFSPVAPLSTVASLRARWPDPTFRVRYQGRPARALFVWRAEGAQVLAADRALRRKVERMSAGPGGVKGTIDWSEAEPLRTLVGHLALGLLVAALVAAALGWRLAGRLGAFTFGLALPAGLAAAANALWLVGVPLHVTTLVASVLGATAALPAAALRLGRSGGRGFWTLAATTAATAAAVPVAVALAGRELGPLLAEPARAFLLSTAAAVLAAALLPAASRLRGEDRENLSDRGGSSIGRGRIAAAASALAAAFAGFQRRLLRDPGTAALVLCTFCSLAAALFGPALVPRPGDLSPDGGSFDIRLNLPDGATLLETERQVRGVEEQLAKTEEVERFWSSSRAGRALVRVEVRPEDRRPDRLAWLATTIRYKIPGAAAAKIETGAGAAGGGAFVLDLEDRAKADEEGLFYRMVLSGGDLDLLVTAYRRILYRLDSFQVRPHSITGWGDPSVLLTLRPKLDAAPQDVAEIATAFARISSGPVPLPLPPGPGGVSRSLVVVTAGAPADPDRAVPLVANLLDRPLRLGRRTLVPAATLALHQDSVIPRVSRQSGRFVVPIEFRLHQSAEEVRVARRKEIDRSLAQLRLPAGVDLERPALSLLFWQPDRLRVIGLALAVPLLLFAVAAWRLGGLISALVALTPLAAGLFAATPLVAATLGQVDELTVLALVASLCLTLPLSAEAAEAASGGAEGAARQTGAGDRAGAGLYRGLRRETPWLAASLIPAALALALPTLGADFIRCRWVVPMRAAALCGAVALSVALLVVPPLRLAAVRWQTRDPEEIRRRRQPPEWSAAGAVGPPKLAVRSLTKRYASGHKALFGVSFELTPGITGLLGPNGAGKTTLLRLLTGLLSPTRGSVSFRGVTVNADDLAEYRLRIGFLPQEFNAYPDFTAEQFLDHWAMERGIDDNRVRGSEVERLLDAVGLAEHARRKVRDFSGGMRQRVGIARCLLGAPPILIVDEPTTGLDIESRGRFRQILLEQAADRIVLFSTHIASDIEAAASRILLIHRGRLRFDGRPEDLLAQARGRVFTALISDAELAAFSHRYRVTARLRRLEGLEVRAVARPGDLIEGDLAEPNLEEAYLAEIERVDAKEGRERRAESFSFLGG